MGRLVKWSIYSHEWLDIQWLRKNGAGLSTCNANKEAPETQISTQPRVISASKWIPEAMSTAFGISKMTTFSQQQQSPISRLPKELRLIIWEYVVGGHEVTVVRKTNKLSHAVLPLDEERLADAAKERYPKHWLGSGLGLGKRYKSEEIMSEIDLLPLMLSCKQIYFEAIESLYSQNSFTFREMETFYRFLRLLPLIGHRTIRHITVRWAGFDYWAKFQDTATNEPRYEHRESWGEISEALSSMRGLSSLSLAVAHEIKDYDSAEKKPETIKMIALPLNGLPPRVELTFEVPERQISTTDQDWLQEQGCGNLRLSGR